MMLLLALFGGIAAAMSARYLQERHRRLACEAKLLENQRQIDELERSLVIATQEARVQQLVGQALRGALGVPSSPRITMVPRSSRSPES